VHEVTVVENCTKMKIVPFQKVEGMNSKMEEGKHVKERYEIGLERHFWRTQRKGKGNGI
jgi:hypothetical protein